MVDVPDWHSAVWHSAVWHSAVWHCAVWHSTWDSAKYYHHFLGRTHVVITDDVL